MCSYKKKKTNTLENNYIYKKYFLINDDILILIKYVIKIYNIF